MKDITFIATDLDGTLLRNDHVLSEYTKDVWIRLLDKNIHFIPATGRPLVGVRDTIPVDLCEYLVTTHGVHVYKKNKDEFDLIWDKSMGIELFRKIFAIREKHAPSIHMHCDADGSLCSFGNGKEIEEYSQRISTKARLFKGIDEFSGEKISKVMFIAENEKLLALQKAFLQEEDFMAVFSMDTYLEVFKKNASKGTALKHIMDVYEVDPNNALAVGDSFNDISMFDVCKYSYVMKNAMPEVAPTIERTEYDNNQDGAAKLFEKLLL